MAAGVIEVDGDPSGPSIEDPEIGTIRMYIKTWDNFDAVTNGAISFREVTTRFCNEKDFQNKDGENPDSKFYVNDYFALHEIARHGHKLKCIDEEEGVVSLHGNYDTN